MEINYKFVHTHSAACVVGMGLGVLFPYWQVILSLCLWIIIGNYFAYKIDKEDDEESVVDKAKITETAKHAEIPLVNVPKLKPYSPRNPPVELSAYEKSRKIMLEKQK